jgi:hypothetical protein
MPEPGPSSPLPQRYLRHPCPLSLVIAAAPPRPTHRRPSHRPIVIIMHPFINHHASKSISSPPIRA